MTWKRARLPILLGAGALAAGACIEFPYFPYVLLYVCLPLSLVTAGYCVLAALLSAKRAAILRLGRYALGLQLALALGAFYSTAGDWVHLLWNVKYPLAGLFLGSGLLLVQVWPDDEAQGPPEPRRWNGALVAGFAVALLGGVPLLLSSRTLEPQLAGRVSGSPSVALLEVARYGLDGTVPELMQPATSAQIAEGRGSPPRWVTVPMAAGQLAAGYWIAFAGLALLGRAVRSGEPRKRFFLIAPTLLAPAAWFGLLNWGWERALWRNDHWVVQAYGRSLLAAFLVTLVLLVAVRRERARHRVSVGFREGSR